MTSIVGESDSEFSFSQASKLCDCVESHLKDVENSGASDNMGLSKINWTTISEKMRELNESLTPIDCHRLWKYVAYGVHLTEIVESDEEDAFTEPIQAYTRYEDAQNNKKRSRNRNNEEKEEPALAPNFKASSLKSKVSFQ